MTDLPRTPCFTYNLAQFRQNARSFAACTPADVRVLYATMANPRAQFVAAAVASGLGVFVNSLDHLAVVRRCAEAPTAITFAASGNSASEQDAVAAAGATYIADSVAQFRAYIVRHPRARAGVRLNVGSLLGDRSLDPAPRLGLTPEELGVLNPDERARMRVLHVYVGTNLGAAHAHLRALDALAPLVDVYSAVDEIDLGGGFARSPADEPAAAEMWDAVLAAWTRFAPRRRQALTLTVEPGRALAASAGTLYTAVTDVKTRDAVRFVVVDTSSTWYPRTLIHAASDHAVSIVGAAHGTPRAAIVCGSTTFSNDILAHCVLPDVNVGDVLAFRFAGAYCEAMHLDFLGVTAPAVTFATRTHAEDDANVIATS
ncbi:MAG TPA: hypothetical protein VG323_20215 [Thermoanaerobaculia bacterium]|nr:hypothetical protein [Thermoanaerobaculia bacterium]